MASAQRRELALGFALSLTPALLWGALAVAIAAIRPAMDGVTLTWYRFCFAWLVQTALLVGAHRLHGLLRYRGRDLALIALVAGGLVGNFVAFACSLRYLPASTAQTFGQIQPVLLLIGGTWLFHERLTTSQRTGAVALSIGLVVFLSDRFQLVGFVDSSVAIGLGLVLVATLAWPVAALAQKALTAVPSMHVLWYVYLVGAVVLAPGAQAAQLVALQGVNVGLFVFCCLNTLIAYGAFMLAVRRWQAARVSAVLALMPVATYLTEAIAHRIDPSWIQAESWTPSKIVGAALVVSGAMATALGGAVSGAAPTTKATSRAARVE